MRCLWGIVLLAGLVLCFPTVARADQLGISVTSSDGGDCADLTDGSYFSTKSFGAGTTLQVTAESPIESLYVVWEDYPGSWTLEASGTSVPCGQGGYLHEFVEVPSSARASQVSLVLDGGASVADVYAFSAGELPGFVQRWEPSYDKADVLFISTHADDEVLFLGGLIPWSVERGDVRVQVAYFCDFFLTETYRNHEILNGLWTMGVTHYPQLGQFVDVYSESLEQASEQYDYDDSLAYTVRTIRRFKPQVLVGQDVIGGEYGHGAHKWCTKMMAEAIDVTGNASEYPESASEYGTWDVPKTYFHLYPEGPIEVSARTPLASFGGQTGLEVLKSAYEQHQSQQQWWFYVSDGYDDAGNPTDYQYSCTKFGLYRSLVGQDTGNDIFENVVPYDAQQPPAAKTDDAAADAAAGDAATVDEAGQTAGGQAQGKLQSTVGEGDVRSDESRVPWPLIVVVCVVVLGVVAACVAFVVRSMRRPSGPTSPSRQKRRPSRSAEPSRSARPKQEAKRPSGGRHASQRQSPERRTRTRAPRG